MDFFPPMYRKLSGIFIKIARPAQTAGMVTAPGPAVVSRINTFRPGYHALFTKRNYFARRDR